MKTSFISTLLLLSVSFLNAQTSFTYDVSGNRTNRRTIVLSAPNQASNQAPSQAPSYAPPPPQSEEDDEQDGEENAAWNETAEYAANNGNYSAPDNGNYSAPTNGNLSTSTNGHFAANNVETVPMFDSSEAPEAPEASKTSQTSSVPENVYTDKLQESDIRIYPNPTKGALAVEIRNKNPEVSHQLAVYNAQGVIVFQQSQVGHYTPIDLSMQPRGVYLLRIASQNTFVTWKIIKE